MSKSTTEIVTQPAQAVAVPDYIKQGAARGAENVTVKDLALPRIQLAQSMSPAMKASDPAYIAGVKEGDIYNTLTRENYGSEVQVVPVYFRPLFVCWRTRLTGGGFRGAFATEKEAAERCAAGAAAGEQIEVAETHEHLILVLPGDGRIEQAILSMSRTQLKQSRKWNSLMRLAGGDIFSHVYLLTSITEANPRGTYKNWNVAPVGFAPKDAYLAAEELYQQVSSGAVTVTAADGDAAATSTDY
jgi:hypothetical protein